MDIKFIAISLNLAKKNLGITSPNPVVGCLIVKNGEIISTGVTAKTGRPHAEHEAIKKADPKKLEGATLYVTLEPCCHEGRDVACVDLIIKSKIKKVVIATKDIDKRVNGEGIKKLTNAGIEVTCGILEKQAREINKGFFKVKSEALPYITLKIASSLDGKIATKNFDSKWITSKKARDYAHYLRSINDAIMIGANTLKKDDPFLTCRINGLQDYTPTRIVICNEINFDENFNIFQTAKENKTIILLNKNNNSDVKKFERLGIQIILCEVKNNKIDLKKALKTLADIGINSILVEGGSQLFSSFLHENLSDELVWIQNKKIIGSDGISAIADLNLTSVNQAIHNLTRQEILELSDEDFVSIYKKDDKHYYNNDL